MPRTSRPAFRASRLHALFLILWTVPPGLAADTVLHRYASTAPDPRFESFLYLAAGTELAEMGLSSSLEPKAGRGFILSAAYSLSGGFAALTLRLSRPDSPDQTLGEGQAKLRLDSAFGAALGDILRTLIAGAGISFTPDPEAFIDGVLALPPPADILDPGPATLDEPESESDEAGESTATAETIAETGIDTEQGDPQLAAAIAGETETAGAPAERSLRALPPRPGIELSASATGLALLGEITRFIHYGAGGEVFAGALLPGGPVRPSLGGKAASYVTFNDPGISGGPLLISILGVCLRSRLGGERGMASASVSAGAALLTVFRPGPPLDKMAPYLDAGVSVLLPLGREASLGLGLGFLAVFDESFIGGIPASISIRWEP